MPYRSPPARNDWLSAVWIVFLSSAGLLPASVLIVRLTELNLVFGVAVSLLVVGGARAGWEAPESYWRLRDWERAQAVYRALGVRVFGLFVIRGRYMKRVAEQTGVPARPITRGTLHAVATSADIGERIHLAALIASLPLMIASWWVGWTHWTWFLLVSNMVLNVYPIMLQRYLRARLERIYTRARMHD